jgi:hypothetical protein
LCTPANLFDLTEMLPSPLWVVIQQQFYEPVPESWDTGGGVPVCDHCGNAMRQGKAGLVCRTFACASALPAQSLLSLPAGQLMRVSRGIRQYWIEPGLDEIRLYDALCTLGLKPALYPFRDRVDIAVNDVGIDLKAYNSPETLGWRFRRSIGGLIHYNQRWVVVPDWIVDSIPSYLPRLRTASCRPDLRFMTVSEALAQLKKEKSYA